MKSKRNELVLALFKVQEAAELAAADVARKAGEEAAALIRDARHVDGIGETALTKIVREYELAIELLQEQGASDQKCLVVTAIFGAIAAEVEA